MSAALQAVLTSFQQNDYVTLVVLTAVGYDYSSLFWPFHSRDFFHRCGIIYNIALWTFLLFNGAADFVMILRVWAIYNRSTLILRTLLILISLEIIFTALVTALYSNPRNHSGMWTLVTKWYTALTYFPPPLHMLTAAVTVIQILDFSVCAVQPRLSIWWQVAKLFQITHGAAMCILAIVQFVRQSLQLYRVTKQWQISRYSSLLVRQGILYFLAIFLLSLFDELSRLGKLPTGGWQFDLSAILEYVPLYTLTPRFILSIRELHARDVQGRRGEGIDTGFGLSLSSHGAGRTAMVLADVVQDEEGGGDTNEVWTTRPE
ncbi:hypothetical protein OG21DRAFT_1522816 [Imleria badia]|nr:hypothetical protein OG21DRAFT_1522816 [Imleria badia]